MIDGLNLTRTQEHAVYTVFTVLSLSLHFFFEKTCAFGISHMSKLVIIMFNFLSGQRLDVLSTLFYKFVKRRC